MTRKATHGIQKVKQSGEELWPQDTFPPKYSLPASRPSSQALITSQGFPKLSWWGQKSSIWTCCEDISKPSVMRLFRHSRSKPYEYYYHRKQLFLLIYFIISLCVCIPHVWMRRFGASVRGICGLPEVDNWELNSGPLEEQSVLGNLSSSSKSIFKNELYKDLYITELQFSKLYPKSPS